MRIFLGQNFKVGQAKACIYLLIHKVEKAVSFGDYPSSSWLVNKNFDQKFHVKNCTTVNILVSNNLCIWLSRNK